VVAPSRIEVHDNFFIQLHGGGQLADPGELLLGLAHLEVGASCSRSSQARERWGWHEAGVRSMLDCTCICMGLQ